MPLPLPWHGLDCHQLESEDTSGSEQSLFPFNCFHYALKEHDSQKQEKFGHNDDEHLLKTSPAPPVLLQRQTYQDSSVVLQKTPAAVEEVINSREAEQNISRVQSCPPVTARAARALEDNLKGK